MPIASQMETSSKKELEREPWTVRRLFPLKVISEVSKYFTNFFDVILGCLVVVIGINELIGRHISYELSFITIAVIGADVFERNRSFNEARKNERRKKK